MEIVFWLSVLLVFYAYIGYFLLLLLLSYIMGVEVKRGVITPEVTFIITAYNEEKNIQRKIENTLEQDYPKEKIEILVASDCSTDKTNEIVESYQSNGVRLVKTAERGGKEYAQKVALESASGEIIVFSDVATMLDVNGVSNIVSNFNDPNVGCVSSTDKFVNQKGEVGGEGAYVKYEMALRNLESKVNSLVGLSGSFFAARKEVCEPWAPDMQSDFNTLLNSIRKGYRGVSDPASIGYYADLSNKKSEFQRKVRTVVRGIRVFAKSLPMLNIFKYGAFSFQLFSHKLCRWLAPFAIVVAFVGNATLAVGSGFYMVLFAIQLLFFFMAAVGLMTGTNNSLLKIPSFFVLANFSILYAWYRFIKGDQYVTWEPSKR